MKRIIFLLNILLTIKFLFGATIYVDVDASGNNDGSSWSDAYTSLQDGLDDAESGDEIWVAQGTYYPSSAYDLTNTSRYYHFRMTAGVEIYGGFAGTESAVSERSDYGVGETNETILSGDIGTAGESNDNCYHVFYHPSGLSLTSTAVLDGFTISGGNADGSYPYYYGGGMYNRSSSSPAISNCTFSGNYADYGGGMYNQSSSSPTVSHCTFSGNSAGDGGGMYNHSSTSPTVTSCTFTENSAVSNGGGIYNYYSSPTVTNCTFFGNSMTTNGGGVYNYYSSPTVTSCTFTENSAYHGGGMCNYYYSSPTVTNCTFSGNAADDGGGMYNYSSSSPTINNCIVWGNAAGTGDEFYIGGSGTTTLNYSCYANGDGDVYGTPSTSSCITADPEFVDADNDDYRIYGNSPCVDAGNNSYNSTDSDIRGADRIQNTTIDMGAYEWTTGIDPFRNTIYVDADAAGNNDGSNWSDAYVSLQTALDVATIGDTIWVAAGTYYPSSGYDLCDDSGDSTHYYHFRLIYGAEIYGGFAGTESDTSQRSDYGVGEANETILSGDIGAVDNDSDNCYHIFYHPSGLNLTSSAVLDGFTISSGNADGSNPHNRGGGMFNESSSPTISNCTFNSNSASDDGGGLYNRSSSSPTVSNCTFNSNSASDNGGGMYNYDSSSPTVTNCTFNSNSAADYGGGLYNYVSCSPTVSNCSFSANSATYGGGLYNRSSSSPTVSNCTFNSNSASDNGGGLYNCDSSSPTVTNCTFSGNTAAGTSWGGGMYNISSSSPRVTDCTFSDNTAYSGGGMVNTSSSPTITNCTFSGNEADVYGGGMYNFASASPTVTNCTFSANSASYGGGMANESDCSPMVTNCIFSGNSADRGGGIYYLESSSPTLINCTLSGNSADYGGGMCNQLDDCYSWPTLTNCIVWGNAAGNGDEFYIEDGTITLNYCCYGNASGDVCKYFSTFIPDANCTTADPLFADADNGNYYLSAGSPCLGTGDLVANSPSTDLDGRSRPLPASATNADMGCYEQYDSDASLPVELIGFTAECRSSGVLLTWRTESEDENLGFIIQRKIVGANGDSPSDWSQIASYTSDESLEGQGSTSEAHEYAYTDSKVQVGATYQYRLGDVDYSSTLTWHEALEVAVVALKFGLCAAYPNPFNPSLTLSYSIKDADQTTLKVYNIRGQLVETLVDDYQLNGSYTLTWQPTNLSSGVYIVRLQSGSKTNLQKVVFVK